MKTTTDAAAELPAGPFNRPHPDPLLTDAAGVARMLSVSERLAGSLIRAGVVPSIEIPSPNDPRRRVRVRRVLVSSVHEVVKRWASGGGR